MYFKNRVDAGIRLAKELEAKYRYENTIVLSLSDGGIVIGEQIARSLHCSIAMLYTDPIVLPGDGKTVVGTIDQSGNMTYDKMIPTAQLDEFITEFHGYFDQQRIEKMHHLNTLISRAGKASPDILRGHNVIVTTDGAPTGAQFDAAISYLKTIAVDRVIAAVPVASEMAVDRLHVLFDELHCLSVAQNYVSTDHYYEDPTIADHNELMNKIDDIIDKWE